MELAGRAIAVVRQRRCGVGGRGAMWHADLPVVEAPGQFKVMTGAGPGALKPLLKADEVLEVTLIEVIVADDAGVLGDVLLDVLVDELADMVKLLVLPYVLVGARSCAVCQGAATKLVEDLWMMLCLLVIEEVEVFDVFVLEDMLVLLVELVVVEVDE
eukprot:6454877-Amphidinium_carterae.1